jgi:hypothetical protein
LDFDHQSFVGAAVRSWCWLTYTINFTAGADRKTCDSRTQSTCICVFLCVFDGRKDARWTDEKPMRPARPDFGSVRGSIFGDCRASSTIYHGIHKWYQKSQLLLIKTACHQNIRLTSNENIQKHHTRISSPHQQCHSKHSSSTSSAHASTGVKQ